MNVNENLLQLALKERQDKYIKLSFDSIIAWKISQQSCITRVTCNCSRKDTLETYTKQVSAGKNEKEVFEKNVIT